MQALVDIVRAGKALYVGISNYPADVQQQCYDYLKAHDVPCLISQYKANMLEQDTLDTNLKIAQQNGSGFITFCPLAQGLLTDRYFNGIPEGSRATRNEFLKPGQVEANIQTAKKLNEIAQKRGQSLAQMALAWLLNYPGLTSVLIGASSVKQLDNNLGTLKTHNSAKTNLHKSSKY